MRQGKKNFLRIENYRFFMRGSPELKFNFIYNNTDPLEGIADTLFNAEFNIKNLAETKLNLDWND
jgi:hypothetical protein